MIKIKHKGFTLVEMIIVILILSIVAGTSAVLVAKGLGAFFAGRDTVAVDWQGRVALERMSRELRSIRSSADIIVAQNNMISFVDNTANVVGFYVNGSSQLMLTNQSTATGGQVLADGASLTLTYYDGNGATPVAFTSNIRYIVVTINVVHGGANFNLTTGVYPWNLH